MDVPEWASSGHLRLCSDTDTTKKRAWAVRKMLLYYHGQLWWVTRSSRLSYLQR